MIVFNKCDITDNGKCLMIDVSVDNLSYFDNVGIETIMIDTDKTYIDNGPSNSSIEIQLDRDEVEAISSGDYIKRVVVSLRPKDINLDSFNDNILFVYVKATGYPAIEVPCGMDREWYIYPVLYLRPWYNNIMRYIKELVVECSVPKGLIDSYLRLKAITTAFKTGNFLTAIKLWEGVRPSGKLISNNKCGCNGYRT